MACAASTAPPVAIEPDSAIGPSNHWRISCTSANDEYKQAIVDGTSDDIVYSSLFTGVHGNYLAPSIVKAGMDPANLPEGDVKTMNFGGGEGSKAKAWKDIWGSGQGIGAVTEVASAAAFIEKLKREYQQARQRLAL
jgi:nitronate monooxygenase